MENKTKLDKFGQTKSLRKTAENKLRKSKAKHVEGGTGAVSYAPRYYYR